MEQPTKAPSPNVIVSPGGFGFACYPEQKVAGFQFEDPGTSKVILVSLPGHALEPLLNALREMIDRVPDTRTWAQFQSPSSRSWH